jgi:hypothetical protein
MADSLKKLYELNNAIFLLIQQQAERYFFSLGRDYTTLNNENEEISENILEVIKKYLDDTRMKFLGSTQDEKTNPFLAFYSQSFASGWNALSKGFNTLFKPFQNTLIPFSRIQSEIYQILADFWTSIIENINQDNKEEMIDADVLDELLEQFNEDIRMLFKAKSNNKSGSVKK